MIAIDLGSNTVRVLAYDCKNEKQLFAYEKVVKTADGLTEFGTINDAAVQRVITALQEAQAKVDFRAHTIKAVTTEAVRRASNADAVLAQIQKETGVAFEVISGEEEARLTLL
ncbi:MAG TPA: phosphatase, partial [Sulfurovum sp.]|nr:phosphatase [Sulfurovum sp.]